MERFLRDNKGSIMLEFAICGTLFIGIVLAMVALGMWMYNTSQVKQAARIAALRVAVTDDVAEAQQAAYEYLDNSLIACPVKSASSSSFKSYGYGRAEALMNPLFPGFQRLIDPTGKSTINGKIQIRKESQAVREYRFRD